VDLSVANDATLQRADQIKVGYDGDVRESDPLRINTTFVQLIKSKEVANEDDDEVESGEENEKDIELNPFGNQKHPSQISESDVLQYIHWMSHQKVQAEDKWGFFEITDERIDWLLDAIDETEYLEKAEEYKDILNRWKDGNFSDVVNDHNYVWEILGGEKESQKATEILSESKEKEYIENTEQIDETYKDAEASN